MTEVDLRAQYGEWAVIAGASAGLGAAFAESAAKRGLDVLLVARRKDVLEKTAVSLAERYGVRTRTAVVDLADRDAAQRLLDETEPLDVGVVVYNAAAEPEGLFAGISEEEVEVNLAVNCRTPTRLCRGIGPRLIAKRRGAVALVSSMAALQGIARFAAYGAAKAYELILAEGLWDEWRGSGVHALAYVVGATASTTFQGAAPGAYDGQLSAGASRILAPSAPSEVADRLFERLDGGPRQFSHDSDQEKAEADAARDRREVVEAMGNLTAGLARFHTWKRGSSTPAKT